VKRVLLLLAIAAVLGATANAISPRGLSWTRPLGRGVGPQVTRAGLVPVDLASMKNLVGAVRMVQGVVPGMPRSASVRPVFSITGCHARWLRAW